MSVPPFPWSEPDATNEAIGLQFSFMPWPGIIAVMSRPTRIDMEVADALMVPMLELVRNRFPDAERFDILHDWSLATGYDTQARLVLTKWVLDQRSVFGRIMIIPSANESALMKLGITTAALAIRPFGLELELVESVDQGMSSLDKARRGD